MVACVMAASDVDDAMCARQISGRCVSSLSAAALTFGKRWTLWICVGPFARQEAARPVPPRLRHSRLGAGCPIADAGQID
jgi:hypothetical protein